MYVVTDLRKPRAAQRPGVKDQLATQWDIPAPADSSPKRQSAAPGVNAMKAGDVVQLNSGGPPMTVTDVGREKATCSWLDATGRQQMGAFPHAALRPYDNGAGSGGYKGTSDPDYDPFK